MCLSTSEIVQPQHQHCDPTPVIDSLSSSSSKSDSTHDEDDADIGGSALTLTQGSIYALSALLREPQSYRQAMKAPDSAQWEDACQKEYNSLLENGTWGACAFSSREEGNPVQVGVQDQAGFPYSGIL
jgi:hypothetical protein